jgi:hypothetical protein
MFLRGSGIVVVLYLTLAHYWTTMVSSSSSTLPHGVHPDLANFYSRLSSGHFHCLDGTGTIPADQVNDDYCDCGDGSGKIAIYLSTQII